MQMFKTHFKFTVWLCILPFLAACAAAPDVVSEDTSAPAETVVEPTATEIVPTPTLMGVPAGAVVWQPEEIIFQYSGPSDGDGIVFYAPEPPEILLFADGLLVVDREGEVFQGQIERGQVCEILNFFDSIDWFEYTLSKEWISMEYFGGEWIVVNGWKEKSGGIGILRYAQTCSSDPDNLFCEDYEEFEVPHLLIEVQRFLEFFNPAGLERYPPETYVLNIYWMEGEPLADNLPPWPYPDHPIEEYLSLIPAEGNPGVIVEVGDWIAGYQRGWVEVGDQVYLVDVRPLWPREMVNEWGTYFELPEQDQVDQLWCSPKDGIWDR